MKHVLVFLLLVAALTLTAQAELYLTVDGVIPTGAIEVEYGQTLTIGYGSTDGTVPVMPVTSGVYHGVNIIAFNHDYSGDPSWGILSDLTAQSAAGASATGWNLGAPYDNIAGTGWTVENPADVAAGLWFETTYTAMAGPGTYLTLGAIDWASPLDDYTQGYITVNHVPEPATMVMVGLGAVGLLRKRR